MDGRSILDLIVMPSGEIILKDKDELEDALFMKRYYTRAIRHSME
jgi:predicted RNA-binding protein associated with RNAse of E/G family